MMIKITGDLLSRSGINVVIDGIDFRYIATDIELITNPKSGNNELVLHIPLGGLQIDYSTKDDE